MHGVIFVKLKEFVNSEYGEDTWGELLSEAGVDRSMFLSTTSYPDDDIEAILGAISDETGMGRQEVLEVFGRFLSPELMEMYKGRVRDEWDYLDFINKTEDHIHVAVRTNMPDASPPHLETERIDDRVVLTYSSDRHMCSLAKGMARGVADEYGRQVTITESQCMLDGADSCKINIKV